MKKDKKEDLEIAKEHISLAEDILIEQAQDSKGKDKESLEDATFSLEKAESDIDDCS